MSSSLTLYQFNTCPFCWKVRALLNYTKQSYQTVEVTPFTMKELDFCEHKKVPVLTDGQKTIVESSTIIEYINQHYSQLPTTDDDQQWATWTDEKLARLLPILIHPNFITSFKHFAFIMDGININPIKKFLIRSAGSLMMPKVGKKLMKKHHIKDPQKAFFEAIDHWVKVGLAGNAFHGNNKPNMIDCSVFGVLYSSHQLGVIDQAKAHNSEFSRWYNACLPMMSQTTK